MESHDKGSGKMREETPHDSREAHARIVLGDGAAQTDGAGTEVKV